MFFGLWKACLFVCFSLNFFLTKIFVLLSKTPPLMSFDRIKSSRIFFNSKQGAAFWGRKICPSVQVIFVFENYICLSVQVDIHLQSSNPLSAFLFKLVYTYSHRILYLPFCSSCFSSCISFLQMYVL
jgi:hypothetical protein